MEELIKDIISLEWEMFRSTQNVGGPASCQNDRGQFEIMRASQFSCWDERSLRLYLSDLRSAKEQGVNIIAVKYARMMERTAPEEFARLLPSLPPVSERKRALAERLNAITVGWGEEFAERYPHVAACGRPIRACDEEDGDASVETYGLGEALTYGEATLESLLERFQSLKEQGVNLHSMVVEQQLRLSGFSGLDDAERRLSGNN